MPTPRTQPDEIEPTTAREDRDPRDQEHPDRSDRGTPAGIAWTLTPGTAKLTTRFFSVQIAGAQSVDVVAVKGDKVSVYYGEKRALFDVDLAPFRAAIDAGVFGVPTFELDGELFWGHDRLEHLAARLLDGLPHGQGDVEGDLLLAGEKGAEVALRDGLVKAALHLLVAEERHGIPDQVFLRCGDAMALADVTQVVVVREREAGLAVPLRQSVCPKPACARAWQLAQRVSMFSAWLFAWSPSR